MKTLKTRRLLLREATTADAAFLVRLMNEAAYLRLIGDRGSGSTHGLGCM